MANNDGAMRWAISSLGGLNVLLGALMFWDGLTLARLGGSWYYLIVGIGLVASGGLLIRRRDSGVWLYALIVAGTILWSLGEVGLSFWRLIPRFDLFIVLGVLLSIALFWRRPSPATLKERWKTPMIVGAPVGLALSLMVVAGFLELGGSTSLHNTSSAEAATPSPNDAPASSPSSVPAGDWLHWGRTAGGLRFSPLTQITKDNVKNLKVAWVFHTGAVRTTSESHREFTFEATPIKARDKLFFCTPHTDVIAVDADTGKEVWLFSRTVNLEGDTYLSCRGVSYYDVPGAAGLCAHRILSGTLDAKLFALDADTGQRCPDFGANGEVDLTEDMDPVKPGFYYPTSPPAIVRGKAVIGGLVKDNMERGEPSGVIRAYDCVTGKLAWAFDLARPDRTGPPPQGETYTRKTPNVWPVISGDEELGLVYLPLGNETPDFFGGGRLEASEKYSSSIVAVDAETGRERWHFQTAHHDLWDYDLPAQPVLTDVTEKPGAQPTPVVIVPTKQGLLFILDRRDGRPITPIEERPVPQGASEGDWTSKTQPFQTDMPSFGPPVATEASMWGMTPFDQLDCRIQFRQMKYDGPYTPPSTKGSLAFPGSAGVFEWGSVSIDLRNHLLIANTSWMPMHTRLAPKNGDDNTDWTAATPAQYRKRFGFGGAAKGTPYEIVIRPFLGPAMVPCQAPPYGHIVAMDLNTRTIMWCRTLGSAKNLGPYGIPTMVPFPSGTPNLGGSVTTATGLVFVGATADATFRAFDTETGDELWHDTLPNDGTAVPVSYQGRDGRQYIVISAGGHGVLTKHPGDAVVAYALPK